jgi:hypothetical protein
VINVYNKPMHVYRHICTSLEVKSSIPLFRV